MGGIKPNIATGVIKPKRYKHVLCFLHGEISPGCTGLEFKKKGKRTKMNV